jgi:hypothetical protein
MGVWVKKSSREVRSDKFKDEFEVCDETGAWLFTSTGCFNRHNRERAQEELGLRENQIVSFDYYRSDDMQESILISYVAELLSKGLQFRKRERLERFVLRHVDKLDVKEPFVEYLETYK